MDNTSTYTSRVPITGTVVDSSTRQSLGYAYRFQFLRTVLPLALVDVVSCLASLVIGIFCAEFLGHSPTALWNAHFFVATVGGMVLMFMVLGLYSGVGMNPIYAFRQCMIGVTVCCVLAAGQSFGSANAIGLLISFPVMLATVPVTRSITRHVLSKNSWWGVKCLIYSADRRVNRLFPMHMRNIPNGFRPVGFVQEDVPIDIDSKLRPFWLGGVDQSTELMKRHNANVALVHRRGRTDNELAAFHETHLSSFSQVVILPDDERIPALWSMGKDGGLAIKDRLLFPSSQAIKRTMDVVVSVIVITLGFPAFALIAVWMKLSSPGPLFYGHERIGRHGRRFKVWKFRSMCVNADEILEKALAECPERRAEWEATQKLKNDPRVSSSGKFLRKTSLDEIPQLWNVLKGEMSLVGPRPIVTNEVEKYDDKFKSYSRVTPGVTGFWQISGRNLTSYERRVELDDYYVRNWSVWFDLYILFRTIKTVLLREGAF